MFTKRDRDRGGDQPAGWQETARPEAAEPRPAPPPQPSRAAAPAAVEESVISPRLKIVGNLDTEDDIRVFGTVKGDIRSRTLTVAEGAMVEGAITAKTVQITGTVKGRIEADQVRIAATGRMTGDVLYTTLAMEEGAILDGQIQRRADQPAAGSASASGAASGRSGTRTVAPVPPAPLAAADGDASAVEVSGAGKVGGSAS